LAIRVSPWSFTDSFVGNFNPGPFLFLPPYLAGTTVFPKEPLDLDHVLREWDFTREQLKQLILEMPDDKFEQTLVVAWGSTGTVKELVDIFAEHEQEHALEIKEIMARKSSPR
jgi:hypothetical protein